jgi:hypothetical protein
VNPQAILAAVPWLRRIWRITPPQLRVPLLLLVAVVGIVQFVQGRRREGDGTPSASSGAAPAPTASRELFS